MQHRRGCFEIQLNHLHKASDDDDEYDDDEGDEWGDDEGDEWGDDEDDDWK